MSTNDNRTAAAVRGDAPPRRRFAAVTGLRAIVVTTALATAAALGTAAPVLAQTGAQPQTGRVYLWIDNGYGAGTVISHPAGINCHQTAYNPDTGYQADPTGTCSAAFPVGTVVSFTATPDPGSYFDPAAGPDTLTVAAGSNPVWATFCPNDGLCSGMD